MFYLLIYFSSLKFLHNVTLIIFSPSPILPRSNPHSIPTRQLCIFLKKKLIKSNLCYLEHSQYNRGYVTYWAKDILNQMDLITYRIIFPNTKEYNFYSVPCGAIFKIDHILSHKASLRTYKKIEITPCTLSDLHKEIGDIPY